MSRCPIGPTPLRWTPPEKIRFGGKFVTVSFDAAFCAVSIQYLVRPVEVMAEVARVLRPGGRLAIATSHRCFPTKAIRAFHVMPAPERLRAIALYLERAGGFEPAQVVDRSPAGADPLWIVTAHAVG